MKHNCPSSPATALPAGQRVLITGAGGFIGSHLAEQCTAAGLRVRALVHYNGRGSWGWLEESPCRGDLEVVMGDVRDFDCVHRHLQGCHTVFHLAALIGIPYSYVSPQAYVRTNIEGTYNVIESARLHATPNVLITSTSETYGTAQYVPIDERHPAVAQSPYAATKIAADQLALSYHKSFGLPVKVVRPFNTYGPRQSARAFIPNVIAQILAGQRRLRLGNMAPTRDLSYVADSVAGFLAIAACRQCDGTATNIGTGHEISMRDLALLIAKLMRADIEVDTESDRVRPAASEVERLLCNSERLRTLTGWQPTHDLEAGLTRTIAWMEQHAGLYKPSVYQV